MHDKTITSERREELFSALSGATGLILIALQDAASLAPIPYLGQAAGLAIGIWNAVQVCMIFDYPLNSLIFARLPKTPSLPFYHWEKTHVHWYIQ
jgi:hypothetical protein